MKDPTRYRDAPILYPWHSCIQSTKMVLAKKLGCMRSIHDLVSGNVVAFKPVKFCFKQNVGALVAALKPCYNKGFLNATKNDYVTVEGS